MREERASASTSIATVLDDVLHDAPDRPALIAPDRTLSYAELDAAADRAAGALRDVGLRTGDRLAVSLPNDSRIVVLFHAAMRLGAVWVGLNRNLTEAERATVLEDSGARVAIGCGDLPTGGRSSLSEEEWSRAVERAAPLASTPVVDPHAPAAIAYTSGTTGRPKGVVHSQHNLLLPGAVLVATRGYDSSLRKADCLPLTILNLLVLSTLLAAQAAGTSVITDVRDARRLVPWLQQTRATVWNAVPPQLYDLAHDPDLDGTALDGLLEVWSGGDNLSEDIRAAFTRKFRAPLCGTYGLSEAPSIVAIEDRAGGHRPRCSGTVLPHLRVTVAGPDGGPAREGELGELCVSAADSGPFAGRYTLMLGYWNAPDATAEALAGGVLHTGDIGTVSPAGEVSVHDRRKLVILRGGANVYPAEVERVLQTVPGVVAASVVGVPDERLGQKVAALVQTSDGAAVDAAVLQDHCRAELARYKVPEIWHLTRQPLPRNAMGKIDRPRLTDLLARED